MKKVFGSHRYPRTMHERRWTCAWEDEEFAPLRGFVRARRRPCYLPTSWDDQCAHADRSWKNQSKRKHQWKD